FGTSSAGCITPPRASELDQIVHIDILGSSLRDPAGCDRDPRGSRVGVIRREIRAVSCIGGGVPPPAHQNDCWYGVGMAWVDHGMHVANESVGLQGPNATLVRARRRLCSGSAVRVAAANLVGAAEKQPSQVWHVKLTWPGRAPARSDGIVERLELLHI